jgi:hypothetical protein
MSYGFDMSFCKIDDEAKVLQKMDDFIQWLNKPAVAKEHISRYITYSPAYKVINNPEAESASGVMIDTKNWLRRIFTAEFIYWPEHKLLALAGEWPLSMTEGNKTAENGVFDKNIYFQNSTDKDYELSTWSTLPESVIGSLLTEPVTQRKAIEYIDFDADEYTEEELSAPADEYIFRIYVYQNIFDRLSLDEWLYGDNPTAFKRYKLCALLTDYTENRFAHQTICLAKERHKQIRKIFK